MDEVTEVVFGYRLVAGITSMSRSSSPPPQPDYSHELHSFITQLTGSENPEHVLIASEIEGELDPLLCFLTLMSRSALQAIYGDDAIQLWHPPEDKPARDNSGTIRYVITLRWVSVAPACNSVVDGACLVFHAIKHQTNLLRFAF
jgi:hypothetical protein